jgi:hypothetical protein
MYGLAMFDSWLYDDNMPFDMIEAIDIFKKLKAKIETDYYEKLVEKYLINNSHKSIVMVSPKEGLAIEQEKKLADKLAAKKAAMSADEIRQVVEETKALKAFQEAEDLPENLAKIPTLTREDIKKEAEGFVNDMRKIGDTNVLFHDVATNGIGYIRLMFNCKNIPAELLSYVGILKNVLGFVDTKNYSFGELYNEINIHTGGITSTINTYVNSKNLDEYKLTFEFKAKAMYSELKSTFELMTDIMTTSNLDDDTRLLEILEELKSRMQGNMISAGHSLAAIRAMSYFSETAAISEMVSGMPCFRLVEKLTADFETNKAELKAKLSELIKAIFRPENLMVDITSTEEGFEAIRELVPDMKSKLFTCDVEKGEFKIDVSKKNEAFSSSAQIQFVCRAGNYMTNTDYNYTGALRVLKVILGYDYLWINIRVKGGAYGCMCSFGKNGDSYIVSFRDPNLKKTIDIFEHTGDYLRNFEADESVMTKYIIGAIGDMDVPMTPAVKGSRSSAAYLTNLEFADIQKERDELLSCTKEDIRALAGLVDTIMNEEAVCVVGNSQAIEENKEMFMEVEQLFH